MQHIEKLDGCELGCTSILAIDLYHKPFRFLMPDHRESYRTFLGALLSVFTVMIILGYGTYKLSNMVSYDGY